MAQHAVLALAMACWLAIAGSVAPAQAASYRLLYAFEGGVRGFNPPGDLVKIGGALFGTTSQGGAHAFGAVFSLKAATGAYKVLHSFQGGEDGLAPKAGLIDVGGVLYGTTPQGGSTRQDPGVVFSLDPKNGAEAVLHAFLGGNDGAQPYGDLLDVDGVVYGTTLYGGGANSLGTVFAIDLASGAERVVYAFKGGSDGYGPYAALIEMKGVLYGTTLYGGPGDCNDGNGAGCGVVFAIDPRTGAERVVYAFRGGADGGNPASTLIEVGDELYGTTSAGGNFGSACISSGSGGCGTVFAVNPRTGAKRLVHAYKGGADGFLPYAGLTSLGGRLYGTTGAGGSANCTYGCGTVFSVDPKSGAEQAVYAFRGGDDGELPVAALTAAGDTLFGTTNYGGGPNNYGTVFALQP